MELSSTDPDSKDPNSKDKARQDQELPGAAAPTHSGEAAQTPGGMFGAGGLAERIQAVAYGIVGSLPRALRPHAAAQYDAGNLSRLTEAMTAWVRGCHFSVEEFAARFFGQAAEDLLLERLHSAALDVVLAISHAELREAAEKVAAVMQAIGLDRWPRVLADAHQRAHAPETVAAIERPRAPREPEARHTESHPPPSETAPAEAEIATPRTAATDQVYRPQVLLGIDAADLKGGTVHRADGASGKQVWPHKAARPASGQGQVVPLSEILLPTGKPVGASYPGAVSAVRTVGQPEMQVIQGQMLQGAMPVDKPGYPGRWYQRTDGSLFGVRRNAGTNPTIDVVDPTLPPGFKVHAA